MREIPSRVRRVVVNDLLQQGKCICGRELVEGTPSHNTVKAIGGSAIKSELEERILGEHIALPSLIRQAEAVPDDVRTILREGNCPKRCDGGPGALSDVKSQLADVRQEDIRKLAIRRQQLDEVIQSLVAEIARTRTRIEDIARQVQALQARIDRERLVGSEAQSVRRRASLARKAWTALQEIRDRFSEEVRSRIEGGTAAMFRTLVWKIALYQGRAFEGLSVVGARQMGRASARRPVRRRDGGPKPRIYRHNGQGRSRGSRGGRPSCDRLAIWAPLCGAPRKHLPGVARPS